MKNWRRLTIGIALALAATLTLADLGWAQYRGNGPCGGGYQNCPYGNQGAGGQGYAYCPNYPGYRSSSRGPGYYAQGQRGRLMGGPRASAPTPQTDAPQPTQ
jgi:hypothetical protein